MNLIDIMNGEGKECQSNHIRKLVLLAARKTRLSMLTRIAGRRLVSAFAGGPAMLLNNMSTKDTLHDHELLYKAMTYTVSEMGLDTLCLFADVSLEAEACGCQVQFDDINIPVVTGHPVTTADDLSKLRIPNPYTDGRMPVFIQTMRLMKRNFSMLKIAEVIGPFTLSTHLAGEEIYVDTVKNPQKVKEILSYCEKVILRYSQALVDAGADIILVAEPTCSQLSTKSYKEFSLSSTRTIISSLRSQCILHICGKAGHLIEAMCQSGAEAISVDDVDIASVIDKVPSRITVIGNISPLKFINQSKEEIRNETLTLLDVIRCRKEFLVAPGCDLAPQTPLENIQSFVNSVKTYSS
jgi:uroporphyrinogen decarboxylase